tara:strand:+ start:930 stop:1886 length:957 start_codon:yes stop_codon:yes gene_type:complete
LADKRALIFGCSGQDGALLSCSLLNKGYEVIGLTRSGTENLKNLAQLGIEQAIRINKGDIKDIRSITNSIEKFNPSIIYNLAAQSSVGKSFIFPVETIESITNGTINLLEAARKIDYQGPIFFAGSSEIYGNTKRKATIDSAQRPRSPYGISKQASYNLVKMYREIHNLNCMTGVLFSHESQLRDNEFVTQKVISGAVNSSKDKSSKIHLGNLNFSRDWGWAEEYVEGIQIIANAKKIDDHIICTGVLTKFTDFINIAYKKFNLNWQDHIIQDKKMIRKKDICQSFGDPKPLEEQLNWKACIFIEEIIEKLIENKLKD